MSRFTRHLKEAFGLAMGIATVLSAWVVLLMIINGSVTLDVRGYDHSGLIVIGLYYAGGALGSLIVALLMPLARWTIGAAFVGVVAALPISLGIAVSADGVGSISADDYWVAGITAVALGGILGVGFRRLFGPSKDPPAE